MPELAEVESQRKRWDAGLGRRIVRIHTHGEKRPFRGTDVASLERHVIGKKLLGSEAKGKQMLFRFSGGVWIGVHLGMTGELFKAAANYTPAKHDHFVLFQKQMALVFNDARQFGRVLFHLGPSEPEWWSSIAPAVGSDQFTRARMEAFLNRHGRLPIKAALLDQKGFPGVGNWMADEILWRAGVAPSRKTLELQGADLRRLWTQARFVCEQALASVGAGEEDPPAGWLFHQRWSREGTCPKHKVPLLRETIGGRTTAWCVKCQR